MSEIERTKTMSDEARAEAERRMREQREKVGLTVVEQTRFIEGFEQGAEWQDEQWGREDEAAAALEHAHQIGMRAQVRVAKLEAEVEQWRESDATLMGLLGTWKPRAQAAEAKLAAVRAYCIENTEGMPYDPFAYGIQQLRRVLAVLDGDEAGRG